MTRRIVRDPDGALRWTEPEPPPPDEPEPVRTLTLAQRRKRWAHTQRFAAEPVVCEFTSQPARIGRVRAR